MRSRWAWSDRFAVSSPALRPAWILTVPAMVGAFVGPALWNGFPLIFPDTGGYLARPFEQTLSIGRSAFYGLFLAIGLPLKFWPNVAVQAALCVWLVWLLLRVHGLSGRPFLALTIALGLATLTSLPWFASQLMPDILMPLAVLGFTLVAFHSEAVKPAERAALVAIIAAAIASHMAMLALASVLLLCFAIWRMVAHRSAWPRPRLSYPCISLLSGVALALFSNLAITGQFAFTPGGETFLFGRLVQDGIVGRYLAEHCPEAAPRLCPYRDELSPVVDDWLWANDSPLHRLGGWREFAPEERRIIIATLRLYPWEHIRRALANTMEQLGTTRMVLSTSAADNAHAVYTIQRLAPDAWSAFAASRQQRQLLVIDWINNILLPVGILSIAGVIGVVVLGARRREERDVAALAITVLLALVGNAAICAVFATVSDRYQSRLMWLAPLCVFIALARWSTGVNRRARSC
jgi:hypothetical protein